MGRHYCYYTAYLTLPYDQRNISTILMSNAVRRLKKIQSFSFLSYLISIKLKAHIKFGYTTEVLKFKDMWQNADNKLFSLMFRSGHCLHTLLPNLKMIDTCPPQLCN